MQWLISRRVMISLMILYLLVTVIESHPDNAHEDLRLDRPFPALVKYCDSLHMDAMNKKVRVNKGLICLQ